MLAFMGGLQTMYRYSREHWKYLFENNAKIEIR